MKVVAVFVSDRDPAWYLDACRKSFHQCVDVELTATHIVDDREHRLGMAGAVQAAWDWALWEDADYLCHIEEDFLFRRFPAADMIAILELNEWLASVTLKRDPWSNEEIGAGGQIELDPDAYTEQRAGELVWCEHDLLFSLNPCVIPRRTLELGVKVGHPGGVERALTERAHAAGMRFAYYGAKTDPPLCSHEGLNRGGQGWSW